MPALVARQVGRWACPDAGRIPLSTHRFPPGEPPRAAVRAPGGIAVYALTEGADEAAAVARFADPWPEARPSDFAVAPAGDFAVFAGRAAVRAVRPDGATLWELAYERPIEDVVSGSTVVSLDGKLVWVTVPAEATGGDSDRWLVLDAAGGALLAQAETGTEGLGAEATAHPDGVHIGLGVGEGQDGSLLLWGRFHDGRIEWHRGEDDRVLVDIAPGGDRFLTIDHGQYDASVHEFPGGRTLATVPSDAPPRKVREGDEDADLFWDYHAGFVDAATIVLSDVEMDDEQRAGHFIADAATGALRGEVAYPATVTGFARALGDGTWLTGTGGHVTRWAL